MLPKQIGMRTLFFRFHHLVIPSFHLGAEEGTRTPTGTTPHQTLVWRVSSHSARR